MINWKPKIVPISELKPAEYNPRKVNKKSKKGFSENLDKYGAFEPIVVNQDMTIIGGHQRYSIYLEKGEKDIEVSYPDRQLTENEEKKLNIILNSIRGKNDVSMLIDFGITQSILDNLGITDIKIPTKKEIDKDFVIQNKEKNPNIVTLFYPTDQLAYVRIALLNVIKSHSTENVAGAIIYLLEKYAK